MPKFNVPEPFTTEQFSPAHFEAEHRMRLGGGEVSFKSVAEDCVFYDERGAAEASIFSIAYLRTDADVSNERPVMFIWNGGPGSATSTLHLECFGPYQIARDAKSEPIYGLNEDADCLIDICDLVFVDPVSVGYSRLINPDKAQKYFSVDGDARSIAFFMTEWLRRNHRWESPVFICGESYGTVRACRVLAELGRSPYSESRMVLGLPVKGVALIGLATSEDNTEIELTVSMMPAMAATHWYHQPEGKPAQDEFVAQAWAFARRELLPALFDGDACEQDVRESVAQKLEMFTGISKHYFIESGLKIASERDFMTRALPGYILDLYDARIKTEAGAAYNELGNSNVPLKVMNGLMADKLNVNMSRLYYTGNINVNVQFNMTTEDIEPPFKRTHIECLKSAMDRTPDMRVLFASGLYDLCTHAGNTRYVVNHSGLPRERVTMREYTGGHGVYSSPEGKAAFLEDMRALILGK